MLIGVALVLLAAIVTAIGLSSRDVAPNGDDGDTNPLDDVPAGKRGPHGTCPSDKSARDCGATLEIWMDVGGWSIMNLAVATNNFTLPPNRTERLIDTLSGPFNWADNYGCRITGWLVPPITSDEYFLMVSGDNEGELWLSSNDDPANKVMVANFIVSGNYAKFEYHWLENPDQQSSQLSLVAGRSYYFEAFSKEGDSYDSFAIAWRYPGLGGVEIIPAIYSRTKKPVPCWIDSDCDDGIWCNGDETCNDVGLCEFGSQKTCSDGLLCTDDICDELTKSCKNPTTDCFASGDPCATDQCMESLGGCQFTCGATLDTWSLLSDGLYFNDMRFGKGLLNAPNKTERLGSLLEAPTNIAEWYASRMKGWLVPPVSGDYVFWIAADDMAELWLSTNDYPENGVLICFLTWKAEPRQWTTYPEQKSEPIPLVGGQAYYFEALMKETSNTDNLAIAWQYPGQTLEVIPARHSRMTRPNTWPATCLVDSDCDDGLWCNGDESCSDAGVCRFGSHRTCSDGLLCTDDLCNELTDSCENPVANCTKSRDPCATDQCIESLGGCQFSCGAILETWADIVGFTVPDLISATNNFSVAPDMTERLGNLLEAESFVANDYGARMKGWLVPPVSGNYRFWISSDDNGEFWLSIDDDPANRIIRCFQPQSSGSRSWFGYREQQSELVSLVAGQAYYFEAIMKELRGQDGLAIAWQYPGRALEIIPARFSMMTRPIPNNNTISTSTDMTEQPMDANVTDAADAAVVQPVTIYDAGKGGQGFSILMAFVDAAGLVDLVSGPGPITVLATTNDLWVSFAASFPAGVTLETYLLPENIALLQDILYYHIIDGLHPTSSLVSGNITAKNGKFISVVVSGGAISFNDAYVLESDWMFDNGVVHIIDRVLVPPDIV
ncbi:hypothetical protein ACHAXA_005787 [Cyclostephanos tholiformis]|uniref:Uncharacterized protein n=1 Tax=Cyclostephanos tholiformis TaxID=382380 RepID=A0ABD3R293_9STRA